MREFDFKKDDTGQDKSPIESNLTPYQRAQVEGMLFYDWANLKTDAASCDEYYQALALIMIDSLTNKTMQEFQFSQATKDNALALSRYLIPENINKLGQRFYDDDERLDEDRATIADVHAYIIKLMQQEINQFSPLLQIEATQEIPTLLIGELPTNQENNHARNQLRSTTQGTFFHSPLRDTYTRATFILSLLLACFTRIYSLLNSSIRSVSGEIFAAPLLRQGIDSDESESESDSDDESLALR